MINFLTKLLAAITAFFNYKTKALPIETLEDLQLKETNVKNQIIRELNSNSPDMFNVKRLYNELRNINERKKNI